MALFGRRKPGFSKEVELKPEDITDEFSDRNDPAINRNDSPKAEKAEMARKAQGVMEGEAPAPDAAEGKIDLFDYMDSLPEVEDPFPPCGPEPEPESPPEMQPCEVLAKFIRERARAALLPPQAPGRGGTRAGQPAAGHEGNRLLP